MAHFASKCGSRRHRGSAFVNPDCLAHRLRAGCCLVCISGLSNIECDLTYRGPSVWSFSWSWEGDVISISWVGEISPREEWVASGEAGAGGEEGERKRKKCISEVISCQMTQRFVTHFRKHLGLTDLKNNWDRYLSNNGNLGRGRLYFGVNYKLKQCAI